MRIVGLLSIRGGGVRAGAKWGGLGGGRPASASAHVPPGWVERKPGCWVIASGSGAPPAPFAFGGGPGWGKRQEPDLPAYG